MQCTYLNYLIRKNRVPSSALEEACHRSASSISRIKAGKLEVSDEEYARIIAAAGGDMKSFEAFCKAFQASPSVTTVESAPVMDIPALQQFYQSQIAAIEARFTAEIDRLHAAYDHQLQFMQQIHDRDFSRMEAYYSQCIADLKEDLRQERSKP